MSIDWTKIELDNLKELFVIQAGGLTYRFTSSESSITTGGVTYQAGTIEKKEVNKESDLSLAELEITFPASSEFIQYVSYSVITSVFVDIYLYSEEEDYTFLDFSGKMKKVLVTSQNMAVITLQEENLNIKLPLFTIQAGCNHMLVDSYCGLTKNDYKSTKTIIDMTSEITLEIDLSGESATYYVGGILEFTDTDGLLHVRFITEVSVDILKIHSRIPGLKKTDNVDLYPGCNKTASECRDKFNNFENFLGFPYVPRKDPIIVGI